MPSSQDTSTRITALSEADYAAWLGYWRAYQAFYGVDIAPEVTATTWRRLQDPGEPMHAAMAFVDGQPAGFVHWVTHRSCWTTGDYCYLQDLFVDPSRRSNGTGRRLIEHVYAAAKLAGCPRVYWLTHETNSTAIALYERIAERSGLVQFRKQL